MDLFHKFFYQLLYLRHPPWDTGISPPELLSFISQHPPGRALDLGCGTGTNAIALARAGWQVTGVDFVPKAIREARRKAAAAGVTIDFQQSDVTRLEQISGRFDLVLDIGCFHNLPDTKKSVYIANLERLLVSGGTFLVYGFLRTTADQHGRLTTGLSETDLGTLAKLLTLVSRVDGFDRRQAPSAWLTYTR